MFHHRITRYETDVTSTLTFVDLAGSEDIKRSGAQGITAREAAQVSGCSTVSAFYLSVCIFGVLVSTAGAGPT